MKKALEMQSKAHELKEKVSGHDIFRKHLRKKLEFRKEFQAFQEAKKRNKAKQRRSEQSICQLEKYLTGDESIKARPSNASI